MLVYLTVVYIPLKELLSSNPTSLEANRNSCLWLITAFSSSNQQRLCALPLSTCTAFYLLKIGSIHPLFLRYSFKPLSIWLLSAHSSRSNAEATGSKEERTELFVFSSIISSNALQSPTYRGFARFTFFLFMPHFVLSPVLFKVWLSFEWKHYKQDCSVL